MSGPNVPEDVLVAHVLAQAAAPLPEATRSRLAQALLDWFTAGLSAVPMPAAARLRELARVLMPGPGPSILFGEPEGMTPMAAAFANAGIAHLREIDDAHRAAMLHPGVVAITPALALAPSLGLSRDRVARAVVAGYEVALRVGEAMGGGHAAVFHATATAGSVGAAAAAGVAMGLDADRLHHALGIAATQAAGLWQLVDDGAHESKSLHPAFAVRNGLSAAFAARAGLPGARAFVTGGRGLHAALRGDGPLAALDGDLGAPERLHTATVKAWPACAMLFTPLDALQSLIDEHRLTAADVRAIDVEVFSHALRIAGVTWPTQAAEASFCLRYLFAVLLAKGHVGIDDTEAPTIDDAALKALADRITVRCSDEMQRRFPQRRPARVTVVLADGRTVTAGRELRRGDPEDPFTWVGMQARLRTFVPALGDAKAAALAAWCEGFVDPTLDHRAGTPDAALFSV